jgi:glycosyltransferase involved in cell wall biosynthesis
LKIAFDAFWWAEGPISNRNVMQEIIRTWMSEYPEDEIHLISRSGTRDLLVYELGLPGRQVHELKIRQHGLGILFEYPFVLRKIKVDSVLTHNFAPLARFKTSVFVHDLIFATNPEWFTRFERAYFWLMKKSLCRARVIFTSSETEAVRISRHSGQVTSVHATGLAISSDVAAVTPLDPSIGLVRYGYTLMVGRLNERKNLSYGLRVLKDSGLATPAMPVVVVGEKHGKNKILDPEVVKMVNAGAIRFVGYMEPEHLAWLYSNTSLFIFPTLDEGFGLPIVEARYFGAPLALSDVPVLREVAGDSNACFFPLDNPEAASSIIRQAHVRESGEDDSLSRATLMQQYDWKRTVATIRGRMLGFDPAVQTAGRS